jgi:hypothetical protein
MEMQRERIDWTWYIVTQIINYLDIIFSLMINNINLRYAHLSIKLHLLISIHSLASPLKFSPQSQSSRGGLMVKHLQESHLCLRDPPQQ